MKHTVARSSFVTGLSWFSIAFSCFAILMGAVQALLVFVAFKTGGLGVIMEEVARSGEMAGLPWAVQFGFANLKLLALLPLVIGWTTLAVSIGLLRRRNWARLVFIAMLVVGTLATIGGTSFFWAEPSPFELPNGEAYVSGVTKLMQTMSFLLFCLNVATVAFHAWIVWRLTRPPIRREFGVDAVPASG